MAITVVGSLDSSTGTATTTLVLTAAASVGDVRVLATVLGSSSIDVSSISGGNCGSGWSRVSGPDNDTNGTAKRHEMWIGTVANGNTFGHETITITWSSSTAGLATDLDCRTFTNSNTGTTWARDGSALTFKNNAASTTITYPIGTAANAGELYVGHARCPSGGSYGTPGGTPSSGWVTTTDANGNPYVYNVNVGSGSVAPTQSTTSSVSYAMGVMLIATTAVTKTATLTASGTGVVSITRQAQPVKSAAGTGVVSIVRAVQGIRSATGTGVVSLAKQVNHSLSATGVGVVSLAASKVKITTLSVSGTGLASLSRAVQGVRTATGVGVASIANKAVSETRSVTGTGVVKLVKQAAHTLSTLGTGVAAALTMSRLGPGYVLLYDEAAYTVGLRDEAVATVTLGDEAVRVTLYDEHPDGNL